MSASTPPAAAIDKLPPGFASSAAYPVLHMDFLSRDARIFEFAASDYVRAPFLDERALSHRQFRGWSATVDDVANALASNDRPSLPLHWLFHIGHCGSTLVSRLLDAAPGLLGLREPLPLLELAMLSVQRDSPSGRIDRAGFDRDLAVTLAALQRGFPGTRCVLVKPTSVVACLAPELLQRLPGSRAVFLTIRLRDWLATMLRAPALRLGMRQQAPVRITGWHALTGETTLRIPAMEDAELMAMSWLVQQLQWRALANQSDMNGRLLMVDFDDFLADIRSHLHELTLHLQLPPTFPTDAIERNSALLSRYAKDPAQQFDAAVRRREITQAVERHGNEIERGLAWAHAALARNNALDLSDRLG